jgi:hypothetical protein
MQRSKKMEDPSIEAQRRAARYWNIDGLPELFIGFLWLSVPVYFYGLTHLAKAGPSRTVLIIVWMLAITLGPLAGRFWILPALKRRITWPRTGYVGHAACWKQKSKALWLLLVIVPLACALPFAPSRMAVPLTVALLVVTATGVGWAMRMRRAFVFAGLMAVFGIAITVAGVGMETGLSLLFAVAGVTSLLSGSWTLRHYLRQA